MRSKFQTIKISLPFFICLLLWVIVSPIVLAQDIDKTNLSYIYNPDAEVRLKHQVVSSDNQHFVFLNVYQINPDDFFQDYELAYSVSINGRKGSNYQTLATSAQMGTGKNNAIFQFSIPDEGEEIEVKVRISNLSTKREYFFPVGVKRPSEFDNVGFYLAVDNELPHFEDYLSSGTVARFIKKEASLEKIFVFKYDFEFDPASPPMVNRSGSSGRTMTIDSTFSIPAGEDFTLNKEGLYFFQSDTTKYEGFAVRVTNRYFPKLAKVEELIAPIVYLSTRLEFKNLIEDENPKQAMDRFWLKVTGSQDRARRAIRNYYRNIESANRIFTNYKPGWKTDMGMIYAIFGPPDEVYSNELEEVWIYEKKENLSKLRFGFIKVKNIFSKSHYELKRDRNYEKSWYRTVDLWRKGRKGI